MKKYLLMFCLMGLVSLAHGFDSPELATNYAQNDSIIVEFGKSGKIILVIDNKEDFERLKNMNVNQIIRELDLEVDEKTGELVVVEVQSKKGSREIVRVREDGPETEVHIGGIKIYVDESGKDTKVKVETGTRKRSDPPFRTYFNLDLGINNYIDGGGMAPGGNTSAPAVKGWGSWNVGLNWMASQRISKGFHWDLGLGVQWYNFKFENRDFQAIRGDGDIEFIQRTDVNGFKSKVSASYLTAMSLFKLDFGQMNDQGKRGFRIAAGPYAGYRLGGRSKFVYRDLGGGGRRKDFESVGTHLNNFRYGIRGELGVGRVNFFTTYDLNTLFKTGSQYEVNPIAFGIIF
ncbi:outer membrane beta-barrel protein [Indibacter alkaliphilus]|nr:outer membrane beta-barrel protein [Indibacter alkaliphilus]